MQGDVIEMDGITFTPWKRPLERKKISRWTWGSWVGSLSRRLWHQHPSGNR